MFSMCESLHVAVKMYMTTHCSGFLPTPIWMTLNDLECLIQLKVRFQCGKPDVRMLLLLELAMRD